MAYCTNSDVSSEFKDITFSGTTVITNTEVDGFIAQADAFIDSYLSTKYEVPITGSISLLVLKTISITLVKARLLSIMSVKTPQDKTKQDPDGPTLRDFAMKMLKDIKSGIIPLVDAIAVSTDDGLSSFLMNETVSYDFETEKDSW